MDDEVEFDMDSAVDEVSSGLGIEVTSPEAEVKNGDDEVTDVTPKGEEKPEPAAAAEAKPDEGKPATPPPAPAPAPLKAPASWRPEAKAEFDKLSPTVQAEVVKREEDILRGIGTYKAAADFGHNIDRELQPYAGLMRQHQIDPVKHIGSLLATHHQLAMGSPEVRLATLTNLAKQFGVDLSASTASEDSPYVDPEVKALRDQLSQLQSMQQQLVNQQLQDRRMQTEARQAEIRNGLAQELNTFAADAEHAFFDEVADDMALLIGQGRASSLKQAYDLAIRMNPAVLEKETLRVAAKGASKKQTSSNAAAARTTAARNATGVNVKSQVAGAAATKQVAPGAGLQNLDKSIEAAFDRIMAGS